MVVAGLGLLAYVGWQLLGTNAVAHHRQRQIVARTQRVWSGDASASGHVSGLDLTGADALVRIPVFGRHYVVPVQEGLSADVLAEGLGHFPGTAGPGQVGNFAVAGHRITHGEPLRRMPSLRPGNRVVVETRAATFIYRIDIDPADLVVADDDTWVVSRLPRNPTGGLEPAQRAGQRLITLTTCSELFHTNDRMVAFGHLLSTRPR
jgi:sortase A